MNIWNKVFLGLIFVLAIAVVFFISQEMKIRGTGQKAIDSLGKKIKTTKQDVIKIYEGTASTKAVDEKSIEELSYDELRVRLLNFLYERKKAWFGCKPSNINIGGKELTPAQLGGDNPATPGDKLKLLKLLEVKLMITGPVIEKDGNEVVMKPDDLKGIVYVFDEPNEEGIGGAFLGMFTVDTAPQAVQGAYQVTLQSAHELTEQEVQRIQKAAKSTWAVYVTVPLDRYEGLFDRLTDEEKEALPKQLRDTLTNAERKLKDFGELLNRFYQYRVEFKENIDRTTKRVEELKVALETSAKEDKDLRNDIEFEKLRIKQMQLQCKTLQEKIDDYDKMIELLHQDIEKTQTQNEWYVAKIAEYQLKVKELLEQQAEQASRE